MVLDFCYVSLGGSTELPEPPLDLPQDYEGDCKPELTTILKY